MKKFFALVLAAVMLLSVAAFASAEDAGFEEFPIGDEQDDYKAAVLNVRQSVGIIESSLEIQKDEEHGLKVIGAIYRIEDGTVEFGV